MTDGTSAKAFSIVAIVSFVGITTSAAVMNYETALVASVAFLAGVFVGIIAESTADLITGNASRR